MSAPAILALPPHRRHKARIRRRAGHVALPETGTVEAVAARIVGGRVGGLFWRPLDARLAAWLGAVEGDICAIVCRDPANLQVLLDICARACPGPILLVAPNISASDWPHHARFDEKSDPWPLIDRVSTVYCDDPERVFVQLAALAGRRIVAVEKGRVRHAETATVAERAVACLRTDWRYVSPYDGLDWSLDQMLDYLVRWREVAGRTAGVGAMFGIAGWKRRRIRQFLIGSPDAPCLSDVEEARRVEGAVAAWPSRTDIAALERLRGGDSVWRVEDGFIRSAGLGAALVQPCSIVLDKRGIYYDPARPGDLDMLLQTASIDAELAARAAALIAQIRTNGATKYNLGGKRVDLPADRHIILIAGQVADDLSVIAGGGGISFAQIVSAARRENPCSFIIFKPHPDVVAGLRDGEWREPAIAADADLVLADGATHDLLERVDAVHVLSSLLGFEALLRGRRVSVYGQPFYAGWGLTDDRGAAQERSRPLSLEQLVAATLILYPLYADPRTGLPCSPEHLLVALADMPPRSRIRSLVARLVAKSRKWNKYR